MGALTPGDRPDPAPGFDDALALLSDRARQRNAARAARLLELLDAGGAPEPGARAEAVQLCHALAGSAGTFGDEALTDAARHLEDVLRAEDDSRTPDALERLRRAARPGGAGN
ncbi:Hpt domain-containing protein [Cellulosimicrobium sp. Marseille-Q4280]|uniref:Hpt domain-containing protein n=1 Tax=Cellulosimicrobium sp. Marseille-Q4280 TaxID=2937992 RepID=UPI00203EAFB8|nr:Hpt domain-containing protein [Cellulosimicrobium sp. Marseille-Q4280]